MPRVNPRTWPRKTWTAHFAFTKGADIQRDAVSHTWHQCGDDNSIAVEVKLYVKPPTLVAGVVEDLEYHVAIHPDGLAPIYGHLVATFGNRIAIMYHKYIVVGNDVIVDSDPKYRHWWVNKDYAWMDQYDHAR